MTIMSAFDINPDDIPDREAFDAALSRLIETAKANNIHIRGGYRYDAADGQQDYGIEIYRVSSNGD